VFESDSDFDDCARIAAMNDDGDEDNTEENDHKNYSCFSANS
jgi:hypothetical protein